MFNAFLSAKKLKIDVDHNIKTLCQLLPTLRQIFLNQKEIKVKVFCCVTLIKIIYESKDLNDTIRDEYFLEIKNSIYSWPINSDLNITDDFTDLKETLEPMKFIFSLWKTANLITMNSNNFIQLSFKLILKLCV